MTNSNRPRRPDLDRDEPQRGFGGVFGATPESGSNGHQGNGVEDDVAQGVGVGYRLIDEYLRRGQQVAQSMWSSRPPFPGASPSDSSMGPERILEYSAQVMGLWFELVKNAFPSPAQPGERPVPPGPFDFSAPPPPSSAVPDAASQRGEAPTVTIEVASRMPVELTVDLRNGCQGRELVAFDLRTKSGEEPRLRGIELGWVDERRVRVALRVPDEQPSGTYTGVIVDGASNLPLGTITATLKPI